MGDVQISADGFCFTQVGGKARVGMHGLKVVEAVGNHRFSSLAFSGGNGADLYITLPAGVAQAMKDAFDRAMAELNSKEDAA